MSSLPNHKSPCYEHHSVSSAVSQAIEDWNASITRKIAELKKPIPGQYEAKQDRRLAWIDLLDNWYWDWFCTFTFRGDRVHPEKADKLFHHFIGDINRTLRGRNWYKHGDGVRWVRAIEMQMRGVIHYHALIGGVGLQDLRRLTYKDKWEEIAGYARIEPVESTYAVMRYVSKYVLKDGEIDLGGPLRQGDGPLFQDAVGFDSPEPRAGIQDRQGPECVRATPGLALKASPGACS